MNWRFWIPEAGLSRPLRELEITYAPVMPALPADVNRTVAEALTATHVEGRLISPGLWELSVHWQTPVYGFIHREVDESVELRVATGDRPRVDVKCIPQEVHSAHAVGFAGVLALAAAAWLTGGWTAGIPPAVAIVAAGALWVTVTRELAMQAFERRLRRLADDMGAALWPGVPAQLLPPPPPLV